MTRKRKLFLIVFAMAVIIFVAGQIASSILEKNFEVLQKEPIEEADLSVLADGTYTGEYEVFPVYVSLSVRVENHRIEEVVLLEHRNGQGAAAESIVDEVVEEQSILVDDVTGATYSSLVIKKALEDALH